MEYFWASDQQDSVQHQRWTEGKDSGCIYQFKQGDNRKGFQEIPKSSGGCESQWQFLWINLINNISRYFHVILVNISDKVRCQCYLPIAPSIYKTSFLDKRYLLTWHFWCDSFLIVKFYSLRKNKWKYT